MIKFEVGQVWTEEKFAGISNQYRVLDIGSKYMSIEHTLGGGKPNKFENILIEEFANIAQESLHLVKAEPSIRVEDLMKEPEPIQPVYQIAIDRDRFVCIKKEEVFVRTDENGYEIHMQIKDYVVDAWISVNEFNPITHSSHIKLYNFKEFVSDIVKERAISLQVFEGKTSDKVMFMEALAQL